MSLDPYWLMTEGDDANEYAIPWLTSWTLRASRTASCAMNGGRLPMKRCVNHESIGVYGGRERPAVGMISVSFDEPRGPSQCQWSVPSGCDAHKRRDDQLFNRASPASKGANEEQDSLRISSWDNGPYMWPMTTTMKMMREKDIEVDSKTIFTVPPPHRLLWWFLFKTIM